MQMDILNKNIILMDHLYKYEHADSNVNNIYWEIKNEIYKIALLSDNPPSKKALEQVEIKIKNFYRLYYKFNYSDVFNNPNPILYISYLSHVKEKLFSAKKSIP